MSSALSSSPALNDQANSRFDTANIVANDTISNDTISNDTAATINVDQLILVAN